MQTLLIYLAKVFICSGMLFFYYVIALRNKQFHYYNRFYLLLVTVFSFMLPLLQLHWFTVKSNNTDVISIMNVMYAAGEEEPVLSPSAHTSINYSQLVLVLSALCSLFFLVRLFLRIKKIYSLKKTYPIQQWEDIDLVQTDLPQAPFSFLQNLFWRKDIPLNDDCGRQILQHEITHIKEKHTWDKLFMQLVLCICWANPFYWLIQKELSLIHEFIADEKAVKNKDASAFAAMLLTAQYGNKIFMPINPFFYSPVKRRLLMLTQSKKTGYTYLRRIMALPLIVSVIALFAFRMQKETVSALPPDKTFTLVVDAGHGGNDGGAVAANGTLEKTITLNIAKKIKSFAADYGINVLMTREEDINLTPAERVQWIATQNADACISLHANAAEKNKAADNGLEVSVSNNNDNGLLEKSKILGSAIIQKLNGAYTIKPSLVQKKVGVWILKSNSLPTALIECGYLTNTTDLQIMTSDEQVEKMARKILEGVALYAAKKDEAKDKTFEQQPYIRLDTNKTGIYGYYEGKPVKGVEVSSRMDIVTLSFADKTKKTISMAEAVKNKIQIPPPPPAAPVKSKEEVITLPVLKEVPLTMIDGYEKINGKVSMSGQINFETDNKEMPLFIVNGDITPANELKLNVAPDAITNINVLKNESALNKYGDKAKYGAIEITTNEDVNVMAVTDVELKKATAPVISKQGELNVIVKEIQTPAIFPGGETAWKKYLEQNASPAFMQKKNAVPGKYTIVVSFVIDANGNVTNTKALNNPGYGSGERAEEIIHQSPQWMPAVKDGKKIALKMKQAVVFIVPEKS